MMRTIAATVLVLLPTCATSMAAEMRVVCETRGTMIDRLDVTLADGGEPVLVLSAGDADGMFLDTPQVLSHVLTRAGAMLEGGPFSTVHTEMKVTDLVGVERIYAPQTYYVDWDRARVWKSFFSLMDAPGGAEIKNCVRVD